MAIDPYTQGMIDEMLGRPAPVRAAAGPTYREGIGTSYGAWGNPDSQGYRRGTVPLPVDTPPPAVDPAAVAPLLAGMQAAGANQPSPAEGDIPPPLVAQTFPGIAENWLMLSPEDRAGAIADAINAAPAPPVRATPPPVNQVLPQLDPAMTGAMPVPTAVNPNDWSEPRFDEMITGTNLPEAQSVPMRRTTPLVQMTPRDRVRFLEANLAGSTPVDQQPPSRSLMDRGMDPFRESAAQQAQAKLEKDTQDARFEALRLGKQATELEMQVTQDRGNQVLWNYAIRAREDANKAWSRYYWLDQQLGPSDPILTAISGGLDFIDKPRQWVAGKAGENAYDRSQGKAPRHDMTNALTYIYGKMPEVEEFNEWSDPGKNPQNVPLIQNAYENGYTDPDTGRQFTGGRAVWELFIHNQGIITKAAYDTGLDPLNAGDVIAPAVRPIAGFGAILEGLGAAEDASRAARAAGKIGTGLREGADVVRVIAKPGDALLDTERGAVPTGTSTPDLAGVFAPLADATTDVGNRVPRGLLDAAPETRVTQTTGLVEAAAREAAAAEQRADSLAGAAVVPETGAVVPTGSLAGAATPARTVLPEPPATVVDEVVAETPATPLVTAGGTPLTAVPDPATAAPTPSPLVDQYGRPLAAGGQPPATVVPESVAEPPTPTSMDTVVSPATPTVGDRDWTNPDYRQAVERDLRTRYPAEQVDTWVAERDRIAGEYRAARDAEEADANRRRVRVGGVRDELAHAEFVVTQEETFRAAFPDETGAAYRFRNGDGLVIGNRRNMIEHAVFGSDADARQARQWFHQRGENGMADRLYTLRGRRAGQQAFPTGTAPAEAGVIPAEDADAAVAAAEPQLTPETTPVAAGVPGEETVPIASLTTRPEFQPRKGLNEARVERIGREWSDAKYQRITVWRDPDTGKDVVLAGHHRFAGAQRAGITDLPINRFEGTREEAIAFARRSNSQAEPLAPTEAGRAILDEEAAGKTFDQAVAEYPAIKKGDARRFRAIAAHLPNDLQDLVDSGHFAVPQASTLAKYVENGTMTPAEAQNFYRSRIVEKGYSDRDLEGTLKILKEQKDALAAGAKEAGGEPPPQMGLFGGFDLESPGLADAFDNVDRLRDQRAAQRRLSNQLKGVLTGANISDRAKNELRGELKRVNDEVAALEQELGLGGTVQPVARRTQPSDVGILPYWLRKAQEVKAQRLADNAQAAAVQVRIASTPRAPGTPGRIVSSETEATLAKTFTEHPDPKIRGKTYEERLSDLMGGKRLGQATEPELRAAMEQLRRDIRLELFPNGAGKFDRTMRALGAPARVFSAMTLLPFWAWPRTWISNTGLGNTMQLAIGGQAKALPDVAKQLAAHKDDLLKFATEGKLPASSPAYQDAVAYGIGGLHPSLEGAAKDALYGTGNAAKAVRRAGQPATPGLIGVAKSVAGKTPKMGTVIGRNVNNGLEWGFRTGVWAHNFRARITRARAPFITGAVKTASRMAPSVPEADIRAAFRGLGAKFDGGRVASELERLARSHGESAAAARKFGDRVGRDWASAVADANNGALRSVNKVLFSYDATNLDQFLRAFVPFHMWLTRAYPFYAEQAIRHPGFAAAYYRSIEGVERQAEAEGWPDSLKGFAKLWTGPGGIALFFNPIAALSLLDTFIDATGGYDDPQNTGIGRLLEKGSRFGFGLLPWWGSLLNHAGYLGDSPINMDPLGTFGARKFWGGMVHLAVAHGLLPADRDFVLEKPFEERLQRVREKLSGWLPGSNKIAAGDPAAVGEQMVRNMMLTDYLKEHGISEDDFRAMGASPVGSPEYARYEAILEELNTEVEMEAGPHYEQALTDYAEANADVVLTGTLVTGPKRVRQEDQMARGQTAGVAGGYVAPGVAPTWDKDRLLAFGGDPYADGRINANEIAFMKAWKQVYGESYEEGDLARMQESARTTAAQGRWTPEAAPLELAASGYGEIGTAYERNLDDEWNRIAYADDMPDKYGVTVGGQRYTDEHIAAMTQDERYALADAWLAAHDPSGMVTKFREARDAYVETHPEYALYTSWKKDVRKQWSALGPGGLSLYRQELARSNPNAKRWFDEQTRAIRARLGTKATPSAIIEELDRITTSLSAYEAVKGIRRNVGDPNPLKTNNGNQPSDPRPPGSGGSGGGFGGSAAVPYPERVKTAISETEAAFGQANQIVSQAFGRNLDVRNLPPQYGPTIDAYLAQAGFAWPEDKYLWDRYTKWRAEQALVGGNTSVDAFIVATAKPEKTTAIPTPAQVSSRAPGP